MSVHQGKGPACAGPLVALIAHRLTPVSLERFSHRLRYHRSLPLGNLLINKSHAVNLTEEAELHAVSVLVDHARTSSAPLRSLEDQQDESGAFAVDLSVRDRQVEDRILVIIDLHRGGAAASFLVHDITRARLRRQILRRHLLDSSRPWRSSDLHQCRAIATLAGELASIISATSIFLPIRRRQVSASARVVTNFTRTACLWRCARNGGWPAATYARVACLVEIHALEKPQSRPVSPVSGADHDFNSGFSCRSSTLHA